MSPSVHELINEGTKAANDGPVARLKVQSESEIRAELRELTSRTRELREELQALAGRGARVRDFTKGEAHVPGSLREREERRDTAAPARVKPRPRRP